jgi:hypothetical protein
LSAKSLGGYAAFLGGQMAAAERQLLYFLWQPLTHLVAASWSNRSMCSGHKLALCSFPFLTTISARAEKSLDAGSALKRMNDFDLRFQPHVVTRKVTENPSDARKVADASAKLHLPGLFLFRVPPWESGDFVQQRLVAECARFG